MVAPGWAAWQGALQRAAARDSDDAAALLAEVLAIAVRRGDGSPVARPALESLPAPDGDALLTALLELLEEQKRGLTLTTEDYPGWVEITAKGLGLRLQPWTFGARNQALRQALRLTGGGLTLDLPAFDRAMILGCVATLDGRPLRPDEVDSWPVPLGEAVLTVLERLCTVGADEAGLLSRSVEAGLDHPDLALLRLCQVFGWKPAEVEQMDAQLAERLLTALRLLDAARPHAADPGSTPPGLAAPVGAAVPAGVGRPTLPGAADGEGVTRIVVHDG